jgi:hypothetical protein
MRFDGPADEQLEKFRDVRDQVRDRLQLWLEEKAPAARRDHR